MKTALYARSTLPAPERFVLLDAIRGLVAVWVVVFHAYNSRLQPALHAALPAFIDRTISQGRLRVPIFFFISGLVITYTLRRKNLDWRESARFILRRFVRLSPPYWVALLLPLTYYSICYLIDRSRTTVVPPWWHLAAHAVYLQDVLGINNFFVPSWTLCIDMQAYLVIVATVYLAQRLARWSGQRVTAGLAVTLLVIPTMLFAFACTQWWRQPRGWVLAYWPCFALGMVCCGTIVGQTPRWLLCGVALCAAAFAWHRSDVELGGALATLLLVFSAFLCGGLTRWLNDPVTQYLGRVSYSLYLVHYVLVFRVMNLGQMLTGNSPAMAVLWLLAAVACSLVAAHGFYRYVEVPCHQYARSLWVPRNKPAAKPVLVTQTA